MKKFCTVMKAIFGGAAGIGLLGACSIDDKADGWYKAVIICALIFVIGFTLVAIFDKLSALTIKLPDWLIIGLVSLVMLPRYIICNLFKHTNERNTNKHTNSKIINISDYLSDSKRAINR